VQELYLMGAKEDLIFETISELESKLNLQKLAKVMTQNDSIDWLNSGQLIFRLI
jgi:hypothetical protein